MILDSVQNADRYYPLHRAFPDVFRFLRDPALPSLALGRYAIDGDRVYTVVSKDRTRSREEARLETHRKYIDVQCLIDGTDHMGWKAANACQTVSTPYNAVKDVEFFADPADAWIAVPPRHFIVFFPEDAHAPLVGEGMLHKVVVKVQVA